MRSELMKVEDFRADIMSDVSERKQNIERKLKEKLKRDYDEKELQFLEEAYDIIQDGLKKIEREKNEVISKTAMENKVRLLSKRKEIIDTVFKKAKDRILEYTKTEEYKKELVEKIKAIWNIWEKASMSSISITRIRICIVTCRISLSIRRFLLKGSILRCWEAASFTIRQPMSIWMIPSPNVSNRKKRTFYSIAELRLKMKWVTNIGTKRCYIRS